MTTQEGALQLQNLEYQPPVLRVQESQFHRNMNPEKEYVQIPYKLLQEKSRKTTLLQEITAFVVKTSYTMQIVFQIKDLLPQLMAMVGSRFQLSASPGFLTPT